MKIQYGTTIWQPYHMVIAFVLGGVVVATSLFNEYLLSLFGESVKSILDSRKVNVTNKAPVFYCDLPYDNCLCSDLTNKSHTSEKCITNIQLVGSRILPLISFLLQIFLVRELFSLSGDHRRVIIYTLWIVSILIFIGMTISIYWSSCFQVHVSLILFLTGASLWILSWHNAMTNASRASAFFNLNQVIIADRSERTNNANRSWLELL